MINIDPKAEAELLLNELYPFAEKMLRTYGEFSPFGGYVDATGRMVHVSLEDVDAKESGREMYNRLVDGLRKFVLEKGARACGIVVNVTLPNNNAVFKEDAIRIFLEHKDGYCADVFYCYQLVSHRRPAVSRFLSRRESPRVTLPPLATARRCLCAESPRPRANSSHIALERYRQYCSPTAGSATACRCW